MRLVLTVLTLTLLLSACKRAPQAQLQQQQYQPTHQQQQEAIRQRASVACGIAGIKPTDAGYSDCMARMAMMYLQEQPGRP